MADDEDIARQAAVAHSRLAHSAGQLNESARAQEDSADRRTVLAGDRTMLASERTYAAWVRTGLAALAAGIGAKALLKDVVPVWLIGATGSILILFSAFCYAAAVWRQTAHVDHPSPDVPRLPSALLIGVNGFLVLVSLAALVGIWLR